MATYSYDDFVKAANGAGVWNQFSQADLSTAQKNPDFGMSILNLKQNYANAATDQEKQQINEQANALRSSYGNYTGGADGSQFISTGKLNNDVDDQLDKLGSYAPFSYEQAAPAYENQYAQQQAALLNEILNRKDFEWSKETDPNWPAYKKEYLREGDRATANTLAQASAASGGRPSSYAVNAATQAGDYYATQLTDKIPELYQQAYERYLAEQQLKYSDLSALNSQEQLEYAKYLDELSQWNTDRNFAYNDYQTQYNMLQNQLANLQGQQQTEFNQNLTVQQLQEELAQYQDQLKQQEIQNAMNAAQVFGTVQENGADILGIAAGTPTAAQQQYAASLASSEKSALADYGNAFLQQGIMPSDAMLSAMGITAGDAQSYIAAVKAQLASGRSSDGSSGGEDYEGLYAAAYASQNPQNYIATHYKEYGFTGSTGLYQGYKDWKETSAADNGQKLYTNDYSTLVNYAQKVLGNGKGAEYLYNVLKTQGYGDAVIDQVFAAMGL